MTRTQPDVLLPPRGSLAMRRSLQRYISSIPFLFLAFVVSKPTLGVTPSFVRQFNSATPVSGDEFGWSSALDGGIGVIGAPSRHGAAERSGSAFVYDVLSGEPLRELIPNDGATDDLFGVSVSIQGNLAVVGALHDDDAGISSGAAYIFDVTTGAQLHKLLPDDLAAGDEFGVSVDIDDGTVIVGSHMDGTGSAYFFDAGTGAQLRKIVSEDAAPDDLFGVAVALADGKALVGARYDDDLGIASGSAYIFDVATGEQMHKLIAHDGVRGDRFGMHLDIGSNRAVVGSRYDDDFLKSSGSAYIYDVGTGEQLHKLVPKDTTNNDQFGSAISIDGENVLIGALDDDHNGVFAGSAYLFNVNTGEELFKFNAPDATPYDRMGTSAALDDGVALIGAPMLNYFGSVGLTSGKAYVYQVPEPTGILLAVWLLVPVLRRRR